MKVRGGQLSIFNEPHEYYLEKNQSENTDLMFKNKYGQEYRITEIVSNEVSYQDLKEDLEKLKDPNQESKHFIIK